MTPSMQMGPLRRYIYGWRCYFYAVRKMLTKDHGAGASRFLHAHRMGCCYRFGVDGQFRNGRQPAFIRKGMRQ